MPALSRSKNGVASLAYVPGIHVFLEGEPRTTWMAGTSPAMTPSPQFAAPLVLSDFELKTLIELNALLIHEPLSSFGSTPPFFTSW